MNPFHLSKSPLIETSFYIECVPSIYIDDGMVQAIRNDFSTEVSSFRVIDDRRWRVRNLSSQIPEGQRKSIIADIGNKKITLVIRSNYFNLSFRDGYTNWEEFISIALSYMNRYLGYTHPKKIHKIGVRNINELVNLPFSSHPTAILSEMPPPRKGLKCVPVEYTVKDTQYYPESDLFSTVMQSERPMRNAQTLSWRALVDIDVFATGQDGLSIDSLTQKLAAIRSLKNQLFFRLIHSAILEILK